MRAPILTTPFAITSGVGMGAILLTGAAMLQFKSLPFRAPAQLVVLWEREESSASVVPISGADMADFAHATHGLFDSLGVFAVPKVWLIDGRSSIGVRACYIQAPVMSALDIHPLVGRAVHPDDAPVGSDSIPPLWISSQLWRSRYGGSAQVIGTTITIGDSASGANKFLARVVGVLPYRASIALPFMKNTTDVWYLISPDVVARSRNARLFFGVGRLRPGISAPRAQKALAIEAEKLDQQYSFDVGKRPVLRSLESIAEDPSRRWLWLLVLVVGMALVLGVCWPRLRQRH